jgi:hypothetical protein
MNDMDKKIDILFGNIREGLDRRLKKHGPQFFRRHETWGILDEEFREYKDAVTENSNLQTDKELMDIIVAAIWGSISLHEMEAEQKGKDSRNINDSVQHVHDYIILHTTSADPLRRHWNKICEKLFRRG